MGKNQKKNSKVKEKILIKCLVIKKQKNMSIKKQDKPLIIKILMLKDKFNKDKVKVMPKFVTMRGI